MIVHAFLYCPCVWESSYGTISLHKSKKGAYKAMNNFINDAYMKWWNSQLLYGKEHPAKFRHKFGIHEAWKVSEIEVKE